MKRLLLHLAIGLALWLAGRLVVVTLSGADVDFGIRTNASNPRGSWTVGSGGSLSGSTGIINLSVQAAKLPVTNYPAIDAAQQVWQLVYYPTNAEGSSSPLSATWQFVVPSDYATNSFQVLLKLANVATNGPNLSNTIFRASVARTTDSTNDYPFAQTFGAQITVTNTWNAITNLNYQQSATISLSTASGVIAGDLCVLRLDRNATNDTLGKAVSVIGLQLLYTRP